MELDVLGMLATFLGKYPQISTVLMVMGGLRVLMKPLFAVLHAYADYTKDPKDNDKLANAEASKWYKGLMFVLDWFASIKMK